LAHGPVPSEPADSPPPRAAHYTMQAGKCARRAAKASTGLTNGQRAAAIRDREKKSRGKAALSSLTGRRQTKWLQPRGKSPDHWMGTVSARKGKQSLNGAMIVLAARPTGSPELTLTATLSCRPVNGRNRDE